MQLKAILKTISIKNTDTDTYASILLDIDINNLDLNQLYNFKHKCLQLSISIDSNNIKVKY